jgi:hypothetical protein
MMHLRKQAAVIWLALLVIPLLALTGCITPAKRLEPSMVATIEPGKSTKSEADKLLGKPESLVTSVEGRTLAQYSYFREAGYGSPCIVRMLSLLYDRQLVLEQKLFSDSTLAPRIHLFKPSQLGDAIDRERIIKLMKPGTIRSDIINELGPPTIEELTVKGETIMTWIAVQDGIAFFKRMESQTLSVRLDEHGILLDFSIHGTLEPEAERKPGKPEQERPSAANG